MPGIVIPDANIGKNSKYRRMNNNSNRRKKKNREGNHLSSDNKVTKQQKTTRKTDVVDMYTGIIDIDDTPDVATWNKKIHIKDDAAAVIADRFHDARPTIGIGLRDRKASKKDLIVDPPNRKEVEEAIESGSTLTDEATDLS
jgi:hypothetical protein